MRLSIRHAVPFAAALLLSAGASHAAVAWDESVQGDLSGNNLAPTLISFAAGSNQLFGTTGVPTPGGQIDRDYFTFTVPAGHVLTALTVLPGNTRVGSGAFIGLMSGSVFTVPPTTFSAEGMLGWTLFGPDQEGENILQAMTQPDSGSSGFELPLPAGNYAIWIQEASVGTAIYRLDANVSAVPEAPTAAALLGGLALLSVAMRRQAKR